jgi:hypothetical protein
MDGSRVSLLSARCAAVLCWRAVPHVRLQCVGPFAQPVSMSPAVLVDLGPEPGRQARLITFGWLIASSAWRAGSTAATGTRAGPRPLMMAKIFGLTSFRSDRLAFVMARHCGRRGRQKRIEALLDDGVAFVRRLLSNKINETPAYALRVLHGARSLPPVEAAEALRPFLESMRTMPASDKLADASSAAATELARSLKENHAAPDDPDYYARSMGLCSGRF